MFPSQRISCIAQVLLTNAWAIIDGIWERQNLEAIPDNQRLIKAAEKPTTNSELFAWLQKPKNAIIGAFGTMHGKMFGLQFLTLGVNTIYVNNRFFDPLILISAYNTGNAPLAKDVPASRRNFINDWGIDINQGDYFDRYVQLLKEALKYIRENNISSADAGCKFTTL